MVGHTPGSERKVKEIAASMENEGWIGPPLLVVRNEDVWQAFTGSHRLLAAQIADIDVPAVFISQENMLKWAEEAGFEVDDSTDFTDLEDEDRLAIVLAGDDPVAQEIMRLEVEKWE